jgi:hypothetical protein
MGIPNAFTGDPRVRSADRQSPTETTTVQLGYPETVILGLGIVLLA